MELSKKVKALRKKQGLSQLELAEKIFVSRQAISGWEAGTSRPSTENLQCLSKLYAVPLEVLLDDKQELEFGGDKQSEPVIPQKQRKKKCVSIIIGFIIILDQFHDHVFCFYLSYLSSIHYYYSFPVLEKE